MQDFIMGAIAMGCFVAGIFFLKFWRDTRDRLFLLFGTAFWMLASNRLAMVLLGTTDENRMYFYLVRLSAFLMILFGIIDKNRSAALTPPSDESTARLTKGS